MEEERVEFSGLIKAKEEKSGTSKNGQPYTSYIFTLVDLSGNDVKMSTFNKDFYESWNVGDSVTANCKKSGIYNQLIGFEEYNDGIDKTPIRPGEIKTANEIPSQKEPDWDAITRGKIRSLLLQARVQNSGLSPLTDEEKKTLVEFENIAIKGLDEFPDY